MEKKFTKEDFRQEEIYSNWLDEVFERDMRDKKDFDYFQNNSNYLPAMTALAKFKKDCEKYDQDFDYQVSLLLSSI